MSSATGGFDLVEPGSTDGAPTERQWLAWLDRQLADELGVDPQSFLLDDRRRVFRDRLAALGTDEQTYLEYLPCRPSEMAILWKVLAQTVKSDTTRVEGLQALVKALPERENYRAWLVGCDVDAYVLALELIATRADSKPELVTVFSTSIDDASVVDAGQLRIPKRAVDKLSSEAQSMLLQTWNGVTVVPSVRSRIAFALHDLLKTPPFRRTDLLICRGVLRHLLPGPRSEAIDRIAFSLNQGGLLVVGPSVDLDDRRFEVVDAEQGIFRRAAVPTRRNLLAAPRLPESKEKFQELALQAMLRKQAAQAWLVDASGRIKVDFTETGSVIRPKGPNPALLGMRLSVQIEDVVTRGINTVFETHRPYERRVLSDTGLVDLEVLPVEDPSFVLVKISPVREETDSAVRSLEERLHRTRGELENTIAALEDANSRLGEVNQELEAANEQFADTNRELECQNEELRLQQDALGRRIDLLESLGEDAEALFESGKVAALFVDHQFRVLRSSSTVASLIGFEPTVGSAVTPSHLGQAVIDGIQEVLSGRGSVDVERPIRGRHLLIRIVSHDSEDGTRCAVITMTDLSVVWRENSAAEERAKQLAALFETADDPTVEVSTSGQILYANRAACALLEIERTSKDNLTSVLRKLEVPLAYEVSHLLEAARYGQRMPRLPLEFPGRNLIYDLVARPVYGEGRVTRLVVTARDVTELYRTHRDLETSRALVRAALDSLDAAVSVVNSEGFVAVQNHAWEIASVPIPGGRARVGDSLLEQLEIEEAEGREESGLVRKQLWSTLKGGAELAPSSQFRVQVGQETEFFDTRAVRLDHAGERLVVLTHSNVTSTKAAEQQRLEIQAKLLDADKLESLGVLAGGVAHDFNNLLVGIMSNATFALDQVQGDALLFDCLKDVEKASERAAQLCQQLLAFSGRGRFHVEQVSLATLSEDSLYLLRTSLPKGVECTLEITYDPLIVADASQMKQVLFHLVTNAAEAIGDKMGSVRVEVGAKELSSGELSELRSDDEVLPGEFAYIRVRDTGEGVSPDVSARMFEPFFTTKFTGRGLGLAAVQGIVQGHKGAIEVTSTSDGTSITIYLPTQRSKADRDTILIVDDEAMVRAAASRALERGGLKIAEAASGAEGLELFQAESDRFALVLLDVTMPGMSGEEVYVALRQQHRTIPVLFSSGLPQASADARVSAEDNAYFIQKPYRSTDLVNKVREILEHRYQAVDER